MSTASVPRVLVIGSGWRFTSGISYYTCRLVNALSEAMPTDVVLMRQLLPTFLYPGRDRVGVAVNDVEYAQDVTVYDGVDWFWGPSMRRATRFIEERRPDVVVFEWWTGAVLHSYLHLARVARSNGARVVMEWHEVQDPGETKILGARQYVGLSMGRMLDRVDAHVVHSSYDLDLLQRAYGLGSDGSANVTIVPHGPYDHVRRAEAASESDERPFNLLFFGVIRPYKGLEDLVEAFTSLPDAVQRRLHLTIVGETWERWDAPLEAVAASASRHRITVVNRYVDDAEAQQHFSDADAVVLPYIRSSSSGPLHMAMSAGLPVVVTSVGGLVDAAADYDGVTFVPAQDPAALAEVLSTIDDQRGRRYADPRSWSTTVASYRSIFQGLGFADGLPMKTSTQTATTNGSA